MNKEEFLDFLQREFTLDGTHVALIVNIVDYAKELPKDKQQPFLLRMLDAEIGLTEEEIKQINL